MLFTILFFYTLSLINAVVIILPYMLNIYKEKDDTFISPLMFIYLIAFPMDNFFLHVGASPSSAQYSSISHILLSQSFIKLVT